MGDWQFNLPLPLMAAVIFLGAYAAAAIIHLIVTRLAVDGRAQAFKALSPGMLSPLGVLFGLLIGFMAAQVWSDFERAKLAVATEASALRTVALLSESFPGEPEARLRALINRHIEEAVNQEWSQMRQQHETLKDLPVTLIEALKTTFALTPDNASLTGSTRNRDCAGDCPRGAASAHHPQSQHGYSAQMGSPVAAGGMHSDCHFHRSQRQPPRVRHCLDDLLNGHGAVGPADRCL
jgi:hypothetical protein